MRKSNNYYKFLNYVSVGNWYTSTICKDNGVLECKSYSRVSYIEEYSKLYHCVYEKTILNSDAELTFKNVLVNNEVIYIYYLTDFNACMQGYQTVARTCCMFDSLYKARKNPEWHHVSLAALANLDFDMLDEKRHIYLTLYRDWMKTRKNLSKCKYIESYEKCRVIFARKYRKLLYDGRISKAMCNFLDRKISMLNLECGLWSSAVEVAMGQHPSRKYNRATLRY